MQEHIKHSTFKYTKRSHQLLSAACDPFLDFPIVLGDKIYGRLWVNVASEAFNVQPQNIVTGGDITVVSSRIFGSGEAGLLNSIDCCDVIVVETPSFQVSKCLNTKHSECSSKLFFSSALLPSA